MFFLEKMFFIYKYYLKWKPCSPWFPEIALLGLKGLFGFRVTSSNWGCFVQKRLSLTKPCFAWGQQELCQFETGFGYSQAFLNKASSVSSNQQTCLSDLKERFQEIRGRRVSMLQKSSKRSDGDSFIMCAETQLTTFAQVRGSMLFNSSDAQIPAHRRRLARKMPTVTAVQWQPSSTYKKVT